MQRAGHPVTNSELGAHALRCHIRSIRIVDRACGRATGTGDARTTLLGTADQHQETTS